MRKEPITRREYSRRAPQRSPIPEQRTNETATNSSEQIPFEDARAIITMEVERPELILHEKTQLCLIDPTTKVNLVFEDHRDLMDWVIDNSKSAFKAICFTERASEALWRRDKSPMTQVESDNESVYRAEIKDLLREVDSANLNVEMQQKRVDRMDKSRNEALEKLDKVDRVYKQLRGLEYSSDWEDRDRHIRELGKRPERNTPESHQRSSFYSQIGDNLGCRSAKMPDSPILSDGKEITWDHWLFMIKAKLDGDADYFTEPIHRIAYVISRCEGMALKYVLPRLREDCARPYKDFEDVINHLKGNFEALSRQSETELESDQLEYKQLKMTGTCDLCPFLIKFCRLADSAEIPMKKWKYELFKKLDWKLREHLEVMEGVENDIEFSEFTRICRHVFDHYWAKEGGHW